MIKLVAFDLDGTIAETIPMCIKAFKKAVSPYAGHTLTEEEIVETFGLNEEGMVKAVLSKNHKEALNDFYKVYEEMHTECRQPYEGMKELLKALQDQGKKVALITGKGKKCCSITLKNFGLTNSFCDVLTGSETGNVKAEALTFLLKKYDLSCEECVYIGDAVSDVTQAQKVKVTCLSALWSTTVNEADLKKKNPDNLFYSIDKLSEYLLEKQMSEM